MLNSIVVGAARFLGLLAPFAGLGFFVSRVGGVGAAHFLVAKLHGGGAGFVGGAMTIYPFVHTDIKLQWNRPDSNCS